MNHKEAAAVAEVAKKLRAGPHGSWQAAIAGRDLGPYTAAEEYQYQRFRLWLETWILPDLDRVVDRYRAKDKGTTV